MNVKEKFNQMIQDLVKHGVITESQTGSFKPIVEYFEQQIAEADKKAVQTVKKVSESMLADYDDQMKKTLTETFNLMKTREDLSRRKALAKKAKLTEAKIINQVDQYLNYFVEKYLPKKIVVDYDRLNTLENLFEGFKASLAVNDKMIQEHAKQLKESVEDEQQADKDKIKDLEEEVANLLDACANLKKKIKENAIREKLDKKLKDVPALEAQRVKKYFESEDVDLDKFDAEFDRVLNLVKKALADDPTDDDQQGAIDNQIDNIIGANGGEEENKPEDEEKVDEGEDDLDDLPTKDEDDGPKDDKVRESRLMSQWINRSKRIRFNP